MENLTKTKKKIRWKEMIPFYIMAVPGAVYLICNNYIPMFGIVIAFKNLNFQKGLLGSDWCGLDNFKFLFNSSTAATIIRNTLAYNITFLLLGTILALFLAILMNEVRSKFASRLYQSLILLPFLISWVIAGYLASAFLSSDSGLLNNILETLHLEKVNWYSTKKYWPFILLFCNIWKTTGYTMIIYFASIVGISQDYYDAAQVEGASKWQQIRFITLPLLKPAVITMMILSMGRIFASDFGLFYQVPKNSGALYSVTQTIDVYVYNALMNNNDYGMSAAASVFQSLVGFVMVMIANGIVRRMNREEALF